MRLSLWLLTGSILSGSTLLAFDKSVKYPTTSPVMPAVVSTPLPKFTPYYGHYQTQWKQYPSGVPQPELQIIPGNQIPGGLMPGGTPLDVIPAVIPTTPNVPVIPKIPKAANPELRGPEVIPPSPRITTIPSEEPMLPIPVASGVRPGMMPPMFSQRRLILPPPTLAPDAGEVYPPLERRSTVSLPPIIPSAGEVPEPLQGEKVGKPAPLPSEILETTPEKPASLGRPTEEPSPVPLKPMEKSEKVVPEWPNIKKQ